MIRRCLYTIIWTIVGGGCLGVQGCAQTGVQSICQQALLGVAVGVVVTEQCLEQGASVLLGGVTYTFGGLEGRHWQRFEVDAAHRFKCPNNGMVVLTLNHDNGPSYEVALIKQGQTYTGPQGEHYPSIPSDEQLRLRYGL
jgi:hypothetical protein